MVVNRKKLCFSPPVSLGNDTNTSQWDQIFPDSMMTVAAIDRVIHHAHILEIEEESYRINNI